VKPASDDCTRARQTEQRRMSAIASSKARLA
jgi:hypothetical protein